MNEKEKAASYELAKIIAKYVAEAFADRDIDYKVTVATMLFNAAAAGLAPAEFCKTLKKKCNF